MLVSEGTWLELTAGLSTTVTKKSTEENETLPAGQALPCRSQTHAETV